MNNHTKIELLFFLISLMTVFIFLIGLFLAFYLNNGNLGLISFAIFLSCSAIIFFFANVFESLKKK